MKKSGKFNWIEKLIKYNYQLVLLVFSAFLTMVLVSYFYVSGIVSNQMHAISEQTMNSTQKEVTNRLEATGLLFSDVVRTSENLLSENKTNADLLVYIQDLQDFYAEANSPLYEFMRIYGYMRGEFLDGSRWAPPEEYDPTQRPWYLGAISAAGKLFFSEPYMDAETMEMCISFSQVVFDEAQVAQGVLAVDLNLSRITEFIREQNISNDGYGLLVSDSFTFATHEHEDLVGKTMAESGPGYTKLYQKLLNGEPISAMRFIDYDGTKSVAFFRVLFNGWYIGIVTPESSYVRPVSELAIVISLVGCVLAVALSVILVRTRMQKIRSEEESLSKSTFLARMSHEMRTPMNAIIGMTEIALHSEDPQRINNCLNKIDDASKHLLGVINDVLDMSKIESGKLELSPIDFVLSEMIAQVETIVNFKIEEKRQIFTINIAENVPTAIFADKQRLAQVITNLLSNANKFTPHHGQIKLYIERLDDIYTDCVLKFRVVDTGIGISLEQQSKLFKSFEQADGSISRKFGGTGLGLAISQKIIHMMNGTIWIESELDKGSTFAFIIPVKIGNSVPDNISMTQTKTRVEEGSELKGLTILLAEDVEINREILIALLEDSGVVIESAENGRIAYEMFVNDSTHYDLILMDMQMPEMDGLEATERIRASGIVWGKTIPIIAMTANVFKEDIEKCIVAGMNDHTGKPIDVEEVIAKITKYTKNIPNKK